MCSSPLTQTIGIIGGGQLGQMLSLAAMRLGFNCQVYDPDPTCCAGHVAPVTVGAFDDTERLIAFGSNVDFLTFEFENIPADALIPLTKLVSNTSKKLFLIAPSLDALYTSQDRIREKDLFTHLNIPTPKYAAVISEDELTQAINNIGLPAILKTRSFGYDGKGQVVVRAMSDLTQAKALVANAPCILEEMVPFDSEVSILASFACASAFCKSKNLV